MINKLEIRFGQLHIPKSAGSSINNVLYDALGLRPFHIRRIVPHDTVVSDPAITLIEGSLAFKLAINMPYVSGHITFTGLKMLERDFIFTVLRDPRKRLISIFTYNKTRSNSERTLRNHPSLKRFSDMSFYDFINNERPINGVARLLLQDIAEFGSISRGQDFTDPSSEFINFIEKGLRRLNVIYACPLQEILDDLSLRGFIPQSKAVWDNKSDSKVVLGNLGSRRVFLEVVNSATWQDVLVYKAASQLFPKYVRFPLASDDEILSEAENKYGASFTD